MTLLKRAIKWVTEIFSKKSNTPLPQEGIQFEFVDFPEAADVMGVKLLDGPYKDVIYYYGRVNLVPEGDSHVLSFDYTIYDAASCSEELNTEDFKKVAGDVLVSLLLSNKGEYATARNLDSEESNLQ